MKPNKVGMGDFESPSNTGGAVDVDAKREKYEDLIRQLFVKVSSERDALKMENAQLRSQLQAQSRTIKEIKGNLAEVLTLGGAALRKRHQS